MKTITFISALFFIVPSMNSQNLDLNLQGYYQFNQNLLDLSINSIEGQGFNLNYSIGIENTPETCFQFNGNNAYINLTSDNRNISNQVSLSAWIKTTENKREFIISKYNADEDQGYFLAIDNGRALIGGRNNSNAFWQCIGTSKIDDGEWHHIVGTVDINEWKIYVDCSLENSLTTNSTNVQLTCADPLTVGYWYQGTVYNEHRFFDGLIDEIRIYNRVLTDEEALLLCEIDPLSINPIVSELQKIKIIPNPVEQTFEVVFNKKNDKDIKYKLYDTFGRLLKSGQLTNSLSISDFGDGVYILHLYDKTRLIASERLIKQ